MSEQDPVAAWVAKLNRLGREMDDACEGVHLSAWADLTAKQREEWHRLARAYPETKREDTDDRS